MYWADIRARLMIDHHQTMKLDAFLLIALAKTRIVPIARPEFFSHSLYFFNILDVPSQ